MLPHTVTYNAISNRNILNNKNILWLVSEGTVSFYRRYDDLKLSVTSGPIVIGLSELFEPLRRNYFRTSKDAVVSSISVERAKQLFDEYLLWPDVAEVLAFTVHMMNYRDEHLVGKDSYSAIRAKLIEYMIKRESNDLRRVGIVAYIKDTTHLSRSLIYNVIAELMRGGYIKINNGKLIEITSLPKDF